MMQSNILTTLTLNILFDTRHENQNSSFLQKYHIKFSEERFEHIIKKIEELSPDIVTFNQVTVKFLNFLEKSQIISQNYVKSSSDYNPKTKYGVQGNLIMVKKTFKQVQFQKLELKSHNEPVHIAYITFNHRRIAAASVHLLAFKGNTRQRQEQLREITNYFNEKQQQQKLDLVLLQGDMNFHSQAENIVLEKLEIQDMWTQKYDLIDNPGYTFDSQKNLMINQLYWGFEQRRMRLDRMFTLKFQDKQIMKLQGIEVVLNEPIYQFTQQKEQRKFMNMFQSTVSFVGDIFGKTQSETNRTICFRVITLASLPKFQSNDLFFLVFNGIIVFLIFYCQEQI